MAGRNRVYHWKHGWIPLTHTAALSKAKGSKKSADKIMQAHGIASPNQAGAHHAARAAELRAAAAKKRAEADRIANGVGAPDRAGAMLRAKDSRRMNERMDSGLRRYTEAQQSAKALESKAHLAEGRAKEAARTRLTHEDIKGATHVQDQFGWHEVVRVNAKTVTVKTPYSWTETLPIEKIRKTLKATPEQIAAAKKKRAS